MKKYTGYAKCPTGDPEEFEFEVENDDPTECEIGEEAAKAAFESGSIEIWWIEKVDDET